MYTDLDKPYQSIEFPSEVQNPPSIPVDVWNPGIEPCKSWDQRRPSTGPWISTAAEALKLGCPICAF